MLILVYLRHWHRSSVLFSGETDAPKEKMAQNSVYYCDVCCVPCGIPTFLSEHVVGLKIHHLFAQVVGSYTVATGSF